jgi:hypothetical protein
MRFGLILLSLSFVSLASAQIDPSSALLLNPDTGASTREGGLDSGRYTVKPAPKTQSAPAPRRMEVKEKAEQRPASETPQEKSTQTFAPEAAGVPKVVPNPQPGTFLSGADAPLPPPQPITETVLGGSEEEINEYKQMLNPQDRRNNLMELSIAPAFIYNDSKSPYSFRKYSTASPAIGGDGRVWFTPFFGVQAGYMTTLSGSVSDTSVGLASHDHCRTNFYESRNSQPKFSNYREIFSVVNVGTRFLRTLFHRTKRRGNAWPPSHQWRANFS